MTTFHCSKSLLAGVSLAAFVALFPAPSAVAAAPSPTVSWDPEVVDTWNGFKRHKFTINGCEAWIVEPKRPLPGKPWSWCLAFPDAFTARCAAPALLEEGFYHGYIDVGNTFGSPDALKCLNAFYAAVTARGLAGKVALVGLSRGGLYAYRWASENPGKVALIYGDAPVCDFKSWPGGRGKGKGSRNDWEQLIKCYGFKSEAEALAYPGNPIDVLAPLAKFKIPLIHVVGDADEVVPVDENTAIVEERYLKLGGEIRVIHKPGVGHHPHGLEDPSPVVRFILEHVTGRASGPGADVPSGTKGGASKPRINGPSVFGVRPGSAFLYTIPATGARPMHFEVDGLPEGLKLNPENGQITGRIHARGEYGVTLRASNARGADAKLFRIVVGDQIALTPPMGWNSWNCWGASVNEERVLRCARGMVSSGLINHGWTYINIDDAWQGARGGPLNAIQPNEKFPDMKRLCDEIHRMGLKVGIYSTPWITSFGRHVGGSSDDPSGAWSKDLADGKYNRLGKFSFAATDARQWAQWGIDYLKYDWSGNDFEHVREMHEALRRSGRDIVFSLSPGTPFDMAPEWVKLANSWRTTGDIWDYWSKTDASWRFSVSEIAFTQDRWSPYAGPGHWNDADMLVVGRLGWGPNPRPANLTRDEQYTHISMWCMFASPLLLGCDLGDLDDLTLDLLTNDEVLALNQDPLGNQAIRVACVGAVDVYAKALEDGSKAVGFFNRGSGPENITFNKLNRIGLGGRRHVRDLWRQEDLSDTDGSLELTVPSHGVVLLKLTAAN